ncbi:hypothetical protein FB451DRAFT_1393230 [Mycena latifolia]|nr:hypothetical protein FB451DRAFT_1393230 [Mycena latifolia]
MLNTKLFAVLALTLVAIAIAGPISPVVQVASLVDTVDEVNCGAGGIWGFCIKAHTADTTPLGGTMPC